MTLLLIIKKRPAATIEFASPPDRLNPPVRNLPPPMKLRSLLLTCLLGVLPVASSQAFVGVSITVAPPVLPVYAQPPCPVDGYLWTPGYWAYNTDYYWVPGVWVAPPTIGYLWTPGYWGCNNGFYAFNQGYWGPTVGFYGGVNYGYGYGGYGYYGGRWDGRVFRYNTAVTRVNTSVVHNTFVDRSALNRRATTSRASFNGPGGVTARATPQQLAAARGPHLAPTGAQRASRVAALRTAPIRGRSATAARTSNSQRFNRQNTSAGRQAQRVTAPRGPQAQRVTAPRGPQAQARTFNGGRPAVQRQPRPQPRQVQSPNNRGEKPH